MELSTLKQVKAIMTKYPAVATQDTSLEEVCQMMVDCDCGEIPVVQSQKNLIPIGVITDRDIACRIVAEGKNPIEMKVGDAMSAPAITIKEEASINDCIELMEKHQVRRIPVVDKDGKCCGIVSQADLAKHTSGEKTAEVVKEISKAA